MNNPLTDPYIVLNKVYSGGAYLKQALTESQIEPQNRPRTSKICYGVLEKDVYLSHIIGANCTRTPKSAVRLVLKIALYMLEFMGKHNYMVADCAVELCKKLGKAGAAGFVNAFLRSYKIPPLPQSADERLSVSASAPLWLAKRCAAALRARPRPYFRPPRRVCASALKGKSKSTLRPNT